MDNNSNRDWADVANLHSISAEDNSLFDKVQDFVVKGVPLAAASGATSVVNTAISFGNMFGDYEKVDFAKKVKEYDDNLFKYYDEHQSAVDVGGFIGTSLIPGGIAMKGLKALQTLKSGEGIGAATRSITGFFKAKEDKYLELAAKTLADPAKKVFGIINQNKLMAIAAGFGEQALQGAAFETGVMLTMNQNPVMEPKERDNYFWSIIHDIPHAAQNAAIFGAFGGAIGGAITSGKINKLIINRDSELLKNKAVEQVGITNLKDGSIMAEHYRILGDHEARLKEMEQLVTSPVAAEGVVTEAAIVAQRDSIAAMKNETRLHIMEDMVKKEDKDIGAELYKAVEKIQPTHGPSGYSMSKEEIIARSFGGAERISRIGEGSLADIGHGMEHLPTVAGKTSRIINLISGEIVDSAFPRAIDVAKSEIKSGQLYMEGRVVNLPKDFDPVANSPTVSNNQFWIEHAKPFEQSNTPMVIHVDNIPAIEAAVEKGYKSVTVEGYSGVSSDLGQILREIKDDAIVDLRNRGKSLDYTERALNIPQEYILSGKGSITLDSLAKDAIQRFDTPIFAQVEYTSAKNMNAFLAEGMRRVQEQQQMAQVARSNAAALIFGKDFKNLPQSLGRLEGVTSIGIGASMTRAADAARGSTGMIALQAGKMQNKLAKEMVSAWQNELYSLRQAITEDAAALYKRNINAGILRGSSEDMVRIPEHLLPSGAWDQLILVPRSLLESAEKEVYPNGWLANQLPKMRTQIVQEPLASSEAQYLIRRQEITSKQAEKWNMINSAKGSDKKIMGDTFYEPPINTERQPFFAMVRYKNPLDDLRPISMVVAQNAESLAQKIEQIKSKFGDVLEVFTKDEIKQHKELQATYDSGMLFSKTFVDSALQREGKLSDFIPRKDAYIFQEEDSWLWNQAQAVSRQGIEMQYGQELAQLRFMEKNWNTNYSSRFGPDKLEANSAKNPYSQMINTFLNISNKSFYNNFWGKFNEGAQAAFNSMSIAWEKGYKEATEGKLSFQEAEAIAQRAGYSAPFGKVTEEVFKDTFKDKNSLSILTSKVNMVASTLMIRMDALNAVINVMSLPVLLAAESSATRKAIQDSLGLTVTVPGTQHQLPSTMKLLYEAVQSYWKKDTIQFGSEVLEKKAWFKDIQAIRTDPQHIQDALSISPEMLKSGQAGLAAYSKNLAIKIGEAGARFTGNNLAEEVVRYIAADVGLKLAKAQGITDRGELAAYINLTVNRVHGNYLASQRPGIFSGPVGQAIGLFQTYQFNMIQQMTRYLQEGNYKAVGVTAAMQNTLFGLQGNPLFWQLNKYIGDSNSNHGDIVTGVADMFGSNNTSVGVGPLKWDTDPAKWMLYGMGANALQVNLYNRGDLTPRFTTVLPTSPADFPAISIATKAWGSMMDMFKAMGNGAPIGDSILQGIAHAGFNRPLAGIAQLASGKKTTGSGSLLAAYNDVDVMLYAAKLAGGEPLNNAVAMDSYYRLQQYKTDQSKRMQDLGEAVKFTAAGKEIDPSKYQEFLNRYVESGGDVKSFNKFMMKAEKNANISIVNQMKNNRRSPLAQKQMNWIGADLADERIEPKVKSPEEVTLQ